MKTPALVSKVRRTIARFGMIGPGETVLAACSSGADSTALLHVLAAIRPEFSGRLAVAHFDHGLRAASGRDARFVRDLAAELGLPFYLEKRDVRAVARRRGLNLEEAGRRLRYDFLRRTAASIGAAKIATGHTLDDQAETVLMRLLRGSGPRGLGGIAPVAEGAIIRPLIEARRSEIEAFLRVRRIAHREDETNRDRRFRRNDIRHRLIPYLERNFEPAIVQKLGRLADILAAEDRAWDEQIGKILPWLIEGTGLRARLKAEALASLPEGSARRCVRAYIERQKGDLRRVSFENIENIRRLAEGKTAVLPGGIRLTRVGDWILRSPGKPARKTPPRGFRTRWDGKASLSMGESGAVFTGRIVRGRPDSEIRFDDTRGVHLDADLLSFPLVVRSRREGDRYRPLGAPGRKKLTDLFREKAVPAGERGRRAVFVSGGEIAWVEGLPAAESFKIGSATRRIFAIAKSVAGSIKSR